MRYKAIPNGRRRSFFGIFLFPEDVMVKKEALGLAG
jgi:hypothetical protein